MQAPRSRQGRLIRALLALCGAPVFVIFLAWLAGALAWPWAVAIAGALLLASSFILWRHFHHQDEWARYVGLFRQAPQQALPSPPSQRGSLLSAEFDAVLVETLRERQARRQELENLIAGGEAILAALPDPLLLLGADSQVRRANDAARDLFAGEVEGRALTALLRDPELLQALEEVMAGNESRSVEFSIPGRIERHFLARAQRLAQEAPDGTLVILALQELTAIKRAEAMRADFVANVSHELRTPLSSLIGFLETLAGPAKDDAAARQQFLSIMRGEAGRMSRLIDDLLSLSRIELYEHTAPEDEVDVAELLGAVVLALELKARDRQVRLTLSAKELPPVKGARDELAQVFQNLIENAIKYGRQGGEVRIEALVLAKGEGPGGRVGRPALAVSVSDEGEGIAREHLPRLTERFYRVDSARSRDLGGTGLGLAIVKHIVNRHRGHLEVESTPGQGSRFTVVLKAALPASM